jgi:6,7-dimethyl-8-ribityllumazine synthase
MGHLPTFSDDLPYEDLPKICGTTNLVDDELEIVAPKIEWPQFGQYTGSCVSVVYAAYHRELVQPILSGCEAFLKAAKCDVFTTEVPGAMDLVAGAKASTEKYKPHATICIGIFVEGETESSSLRFQATVNGIQTMNAAGVGPIICGVSFCKTEAQAKERSTEAVGGEWAKSALQMLNLSA